MKRELIIVLNRADWKYRDTIALLVIPMELLLGWLLSKTPLMNYRMLAACIPFLLKAISMSAIILLYRKLLADDWRLFKKRLWLKLLVCIGLAVGMTFVLSGVRSLVGIAQSAEALEAVTGGLPFGLFLLTAFTPVLAPVTEEIVFRHVLFYKFKEQKSLCVLMCIGSAFSFGVIHYNNFGGNLMLTVPYMAIACIYNLLYLFTKNVWASTMTHLIFNFSQSVIPAMMLPIIIFFNAGAM